MLPPQDFQIISLLLFDKFEYVLYNSRSIKNADHAINRGNNTKNRYIFSFKAWNKVDSSYQMFRFSISYTQFSNSFQRKEKFNKTTRLVAKRAMLWIKVNAENPTLQWEYFWT